MSGTLYTIGHSTKTARELNRALLTHGVEGVVDVRSRPYSSFNPQFNKPEVKRSLEQAGLRYKWLGWGLGGLDSIEPSRKAEAIDELRRLLHSGKTIALMCSEGKPEACHRAGLINDLIEQGVVERAFHILPDGRMSGAIMQMGLFL